MTERMSQEFRVNNICFQAFLLQIMALADGEFAFTPALSLSHALYFSPRSCSFFHLEAHFTEKLVNIDEGRIGIGIHDRSP